MDQIYTNLKKYGKVKINESLAKHTTFKFGGSVKYFILIDKTDKLIKVLQFLREENVEFIILGGGSNVLWGDETFDGVVIKIANQEIKLLENNVLLVDAGCVTVAVARESVKLGLTGFEWGIGIPGTIGGAVHGNAGAMGGDMSTNLLKVEVFRQGEILELNNKECEFVYRDSAFKHNNDVVLRVWLQLQKSTIKSKDLMKKALENIQYRNSTQPQGFASSGCIFKNVSVEKWKKENGEDIPELFVGKLVISAGWMIEQSGAKGDKVGQAQVSEKHGNFIINLGGATFVDVKNLIEEIKEKVYNKFKINLEEEVQEIDL
ncbi:MAG: UDP-N-acetylenolpyruvoylglucosamine reductase [Candidatus Magasanikbacteria bacterium CG1_02_32_51]|uniref:UDP-N-acetylenolpyruvoylglucosamine reductase n=1 Tax=Candidatus Magasanikbacteria bacterium CG1_02_32_51 TaxID=1805238 RepID=A0A1J4UCR3_9BACT|nr:MAG: UDP-N-acetylenolpyruvoylglucosamine reductase [Candidatus Magasanikbacteria bacterium CG1_02_32_51]